MSFGVHTECIGYLPLTLNNQSNPQVVREAVLGARDIDDEKPTSRYKLEVMPDYYR